MFTQNNRPGQLLAHHKRRAVNRTGGTVAVGDVLAFDMAAGDAATPAGEGVGGSTGLDAQDAIFQNLVAVAAGNLDGLVVVVSSVLSGGGVDDAEIEVSLVAQRIAVKVNAATTSVAAGDRLKPTSGSDALTKLTAAAADRRAVAYAEESASADGALIDVMFFGGVPFAGALGS